MATTVRVDNREFTASLRQYVKLSRTAFPDIANRKAFFIARGATRETPKADKNTIKSQLGSLIGRKGKKRRLKLAQGTTHDAPLAALIINAWRGRAGKPGLFGAEMRDAIEKLLALRMRSIAFIKSGWLPAIRILGAKVRSKSGAPREDKSAAIVGKDKGRAIPARDGAFRVRATIENSASTSRDKKQALFKYGEPALERAFAAETASTIAEIERRLREAAQKARIRTN